ncbi:MAG: hypothetical protein M3Z07_02265 [Candidatus Eremiobacteraeota bacterium]|nr:hypothetical protein [Candidatus Eremiobacteraeota bacterium]
MIARFVSAILENVAILLFVLAIVTSVLKLRRAGRRRIVATAAYVFWGEILFYGVGLVMLWAFLFHAFFQHIAASSIGWQPSPFEWELAWAELGLAIVAMLALYRGFEMRLAATVAFVILASGAAIQHVHQLRCCHNYAPGNAGLVLWFNDIFVSLTVLVLAFASRDAYERQSSRRNLTRGARPL